MTTLDRIKKLSKEKGLSLQKVAKDAGIGVNSIYRWSKITPSLSSLESVADVLGVSVDYLLGNTDNRYAKGFNSMFNRKVNQLLEDLRILDKNMTNPFIDEVEIIRQKNKIKVEYDGVILLLDKVSLKIMGVNLDYILSDETNYSPYSQQVLMQLVENLTKKMRALEDEEKYDSLISDDLKTMLDSVPEEKRGEVLVKVKSYIQGLIDAQE